MRAVGVRHREGDVGHVLAYEREVRDRLDEAVGPGRLGRVRVGRLDQVLAHQGGQSVTAREPEPFLTLLDIQPQPEQTVGIEVDATVDHHERLGRRFQQPIGLDVGERQPRRRIGIREPGHGVLGGVAEG